MIVANVKIHYGAYSKRYYTYWSQDVSGGCFRTIIPSGNWCTITSESGPKEGRIEHLLNKLVRKVRKKRNQSESPSVGALDAQSVKWGNRKSDNGFDANKKVKGIKRNIVVDRNGFILARQYAVHRFMIPIRLTHCVMLQTESGNGLKRFLLTGVIEGRLLKILKRFCNQP